MVVTCNWMMANFLSLLSLSLLSLSLSLSLSFSLSLSLFLCLSVSVSVSVSLQSTCKWIHCFLSLSPPLSLSLSLSLPPPLSLSLSRSTGKLRKRTVIKARHGRHTWEKSGSCRKSVALRRMTTNAHWSNNKQKYQELVEEERGNWIKKEREREKEMWVCVNIKVLLDECF